MCEQLAQGCYVERSGRDSNLRPLGCKSDALSTTPPLKLSVIFVLWCRRGRQMPVGAVTRRCRVRSCWRRLRGTHRGGCTTAARYGGRRTLPRRHVVQPPSPATTSPRRGRTEPVESRVLALCLRTPRPACTALSTTDLHQLIL